MNSFAEKKISYFSKAKINEVFTALGSSAKGLSSSAAATRLKSNSNKIKIAEENVLFDLLSHFKSPLILILLLAAFISSLLGETMNAVIITVMVLIGAILDFVEERSAGQAAKKLKNSVKTTATILRDGEQKEISVCGVCAGDIVILNAGDLVPADARIIYAKDLYVDQSALTGESFPAEKSADVGEKDDDYRNLLYYGTSIISGSAEAIVFQTGAQTEFGRIASSLARHSEKSEFEVGTAKFGVFIAKIVFFLVLFIFFFNIVRNLSVDSANLNANIIQSFLFAVAIAVGVTPELLPMIMSITMARGSIRMSKKGVIVKKLGAIPNFGSMEILCADKTGTLTENKIALVTYTDIDGHVSKPVFFYAYLTSYFETGIENSLDAALLDFKKISVDGYKKIDELPFDFERKMMSVVVESDNGQTLITKGSPEALFTCCKYYAAGARKAKLGTAAREICRRQFEKLSAEGYRVLGVARKELKRTKQVYEKCDECDLEFLGFVAFLDPPKAGTREALDGLESMGIEVKIITGDNELVTQKICREVGLNVSGLVLGRDIDKMRDDALQAVAQRTTIFARCSPGQKNRVIQALRARNKVVGYLGDGINDAPSLKGADVGISVNNAVDVAKDAADIVLTKKDFSVLREGVLEGRRVFGNTMKYIMMGLSSNFGNMFSAAGAIMFLPFLPMLPIQVLLNNFLYDLSQITIPMDKVDREWIQKPRRWNIRFIKKFMYFFGPVSSFFDFVTFFLLYKVFSAGPALFQTGWFVESLATQVLVIHVIRTKRVPFLESMSSKSLIFSTFFCVAIGWMIPWTQVGKFFGFQPLPAGMIGAIVLIVIVYLFVVETLKRRFYASIRENSPV